MDGKARAARWRARQVAEGGKPIGVTLTSAAAQALESLQATFNWSQREAISSALEFAASNLPQADSPQCPGAPECAPGPHVALSRIEELEQRLQQLEAKLVSQEITLPEPTPQEVAADNKRQLLLFTAKQMLEHGERMSRVQLYSLAKQHGVPVPETQHSYSVFISYHMDLIRELMRSLKERAH